MTAVKESMNDIGTLKNDGFITVQLDEPIIRGKTTITEIQLRKPRAGELRGVTLVDVANLDVMALQKVLPRITEPALTPQDVSNLELADLMSLGTEVASFLAKKEIRAAFPSV